jgi:hypothetical protein
MPPGDNPIAVNKYIILYHIISTVCDTAHNISTVYDTAHISTVCNTSHTRIISAVCDTTHTITTSFTMINTKVKEKSTLF